MRLLLAVIVLFSASLCISAFTCTQKDFEAFKVEYKRSYETPQEDNKRFKIFCKNLLEAEKLNALHPNTEFGVNKFSDLSKEEFSRRYLGCRTPKNLPKHDGAKDLAPMDLPNYFDWRFNTSTPVVTPVKNQLECGSCWAFSATENIESIWARAGNQLTELSVQQIVDCDTRDGGCGGGDPNTAFDYVIGAKGLETESDYPYRAQNGQCTFDSSKIAAHISSYESAGTKNEDDMAAYLVAKGPISVCVDATTWSPYRGGVFPGSQCHQPNTDHCVLLVGFNLPGKYWIVRNSWGAEWGVSGYMYLEYGVDACLVANYPVSSIV